MILQWLGNLMRVLDYKKTLTNLCSGQIFGCFISMQLNVKWQFTCSNIHHGATSLSTVLEIVKEEKDLGVWCTNDLKPSLYCQRAALKANQVLGLIWRSFKINSVNMLVILYVWPHPSRILHTSLEPIPGKRHRHVGESSEMCNQMSSRPTVSQLSYEDCLKKLDLYSLYCRCQRGDLIEVYKILNGYYNLNPSTFFTLNNTTVTRGHQFKLFKVRARLPVRHNFFY